MAEYVGSFAALRADEVGHILHDAENLDSYLPEHEDRLAGILQCDVLRRADHDGAHQWNGLSEGQLHIARAGGKVDEQVVKLTPIHLSHELSDDAMEHRS